MAEGEERAGLRVGADKTYAEINLPPETPIGEVWELIRSRGITQGVSEAKLAEALAQPGTWVRFAEGIAPTPPVHSVPVHHFDIGKKPHIAQGEDGKVDFKELGFIHNVRAGDLLASLPPPTPGTPGRNIYGHIIPVPEPKTTPLKPGTHVALSADERELRAEIDGRVFLDPAGRVCVDNQLRVPGDVGPSTGNINFLGSLRVAGNVLSGYKIKATGEVEIMGTVESAIIDAGGELRIHGGVFGGGKAVLQSKNSIRVKHAQEAMILCGATLVVQDSLLRVTAVAARAIEMERGTVVGGTINAPEIRLGGLGSESSVRTIVELGISPRARLYCTQLEAEFRSLREQLLKINAKLHPLVATADSGKVMMKEDHDAMVRLEQEETDLKRKIVGVAAEIRRRLHDPGSHIDGVLDVAAAVHPGVVISTISAEKAIGMKRMGLKLAAARGQFAETAEE